MERLCLFWYGVCITRLMAPLTVLLERVESEAFLLTGSPDLTNCLLLKFRLTVVSFCFFYCYIFFFMLTAFRNLKTAWLLSSCICAAIDFSLFLTKLQTPYATVNQYLCSLIPLTYQLWSRLLVSVFLPFSDLHHLKREVLRHIAFCFWIILIGLLAFWGGAICCLLFSLLLSCFLCSKKERKKSGDLTVDGEGCSRIYSTWLTQETNTVAMKLPLAGTQMFVHWRLDWSVFNCTYLYIPRNKRWLPWMPLGQKFPKKSSCHTLSEAPAISKAKMTVSKHSSRASCQPLVKR